MTPDQVSALRELLAAAAGFALGALSMLGASWRRARTPQDARGAPADPSVHPKGDPYRWPGVELESRRKLGGPASW